MDFLSVLYYTAIAVGLITLIATAGAVASRKYNFKYTLFTIPSLVVYVVNSCIVAMHSNLVITIVSAILLGFYDSTIGLKLSVSYKANANFTDEQIVSGIDGKTVISMLIISVVFALVGYGISQKMA